MKKITLTIFSLLVVLAAIATPFNLQGAILGPVALDPLTLEALLGSSPKATRKYLTSSIDLLMAKLEKIDHDNRFDQDLCPPCAERIKEKPGLAVYYHSLKAVCDELEKICDVVVLEEIILDFCEGWNDFARYLNSEYSEQQIIKYYTERIPRNWRRDLKVNAYAAGINTAALHYRKAFCWTDSRFYKCVKILKTIPEEDFIE